MRVLVTGASGYLAQFLLQLLSEEAGYELFTTYRSDQTEGVPATAVQLDVADPQTFGATLECAPDVVVHAAAEENTRPSWC